MKKDEFLKELESHLQGLNKIDRDERVLFYKEMIEDRIEEGKSEEEAINDLGGIDKVVNDIASETPLVKLIKEKAKPKRALRVWEIILLILGFPLWFPLLLVFIILCLLLYLLIWIGVIVIYAIEASLIGGGVACLVIFLIYLFGGELSFIYLGGGLMSLGVSFFLLFGCKGITVATCKLSKRTVINIKSWFIKGERK